VLVPTPEGDNERVPLFPMERLAVDHGGPAAAKGVVDAGARVAVSLSSHSRAKHLHPTGKRRQGRAAG